MSRRQRQGLSLRAVHRALKLGRTIPDLEADEALRAVPCAKR